MYVSMGARWIFSRGGQIRGLGTKVPQWGPGTDPGGDLPAQRPEADNITKIMHK